MKMFSGTFYFCQEHENIPSLALEDVKGMILLHNYSNGSTILPLFRSFKSTCRPAHDLLTLPSADKVTLSNCSWLRRKFFKLRMFWSFSSSIFILFLNQQINSQMRIKAAFYGFSSIARAQERIEMFMVYYHFRFTPHNSPGHHS